MIVALCGSGRYKARIHDLGGELTRVGFVVLTPPLHDIDGLLGHDWGEAKELAWKGATFAHMNRISKAGVVLMANFDGYLGVSSSLELGYAVAAQKLVVALRSDHAEPARSVLFDFVLDEEDSVAAVRALRSMVT